MTASTYATLSDFKNRNPNLLQDARYDTAIQGYLNAAANMVDRYTRRGIPGVEVFSQSASSTRYFNDHIYADGKLAITDALTITAITRNDTAQVLDTDYYLLPDLRGIDPITHLYFPGLSYTYAYSSYGIKQIAVIGTWGYCTLANRPAEIMEAVCIQAMRMYERANLSPQEITQSLVNPWKGLDPNVEAMMEPYRRMVYVA